MKQTSKGKTRVERVAQAVAEQVKAQNSEHNGDARRENDPPGQWTILRAIMTLRNRTCYNRNRGSSASRKPSPSRLKPNTVSIIAKPGKNTKCGALKTWFRSAANMAPHSGCGG